jgi:hypothetical protein
MSNISVVDFFQILANLSIVLGIPVSLYLFYTEKEKERREREYGTYNALDDKYIDYLKLCLAYPEYDIFDIPNEENKEMSPEKRRMQLMLFSILVSILERSFLMYKDQSTKIKRDQWSGWDSYIRDYTSRISFREAWKLIGDDFDRNFVEYVNNIIKSIELEKEIDTPIIKSEQSIIKKGVGSK